jgi:hypothetical protein
MSAGGKAKSKGEVKALDKRKSSDARTRDVEIGESTALKKKPMYRA